MDYDLSDRRHDHDHDHEVEVEDAQGKLQRIAVGCECRPQGTVVVLGSHKGTLR